MIIKVKALPRLIQNVVAFTKINNKHTTFTRIN